MTTAFDPGPVMDAPAENIVKPMLAKDPADIDALPFPLLVQPKLDGIRALVINGKLLSRTLKPIPNNEIREALERPEFEGFDGEIIVGDGTNFQAISSFVMAPNKTGADWSYNVFDLWNHLGTNEQRSDALMERICGGDLPDYIVAVTTHYAEDSDALALIEEACLEQGLEGAIARLPEAKYKFGRSSPKKGPLWKIKRFIDFEAEVIGVFEKMHNDNPAMTNALGRTERSTAKAGKRGAGVLGGLVLRAINGPAEGVEFRCGTGFNDEQRTLLWVQHQAAHPTSAVLIGKVAKIKSFPIGVKDKPRFPVFLGFRNMEIDG